MKYTNRELKLHARTSLLGHYGTVIATLIFSQLVVGLINTPFHQMTQQGLAYGAIFRIVLGLIGTLVVSLLSYVFGAGLAYVHLKIARGQQTRFSELFYVFKNRPDRYFGYAGCLMILTTCLNIPIILVGVFLSSYQTTVINGSGSYLLFLVLAVLGIVCSIILIVLTLALALTPYILLDNPSMRVPAAMRLSMQLMRGNKWRLFVLQFSFLGWILFSLLSFGIGLLWVLPYLTQSVTWFYLGFITDEPEDNI